MSRPYAPRSRVTTPQHRLNGKIRAREVRVLGPDNQQLGIHPLPDALRMAQNLGVDLVEIAAEATPPVCRLVDYGKFRYEEAKKQKNTADRPRNLLKEIQLRPGIATNDYSTKLNNARGFLEEGLQVKVVLRFRAREMRHPELGLEIMEKFAADLADCARLDAPLRRVERSLNMMLRPVSRQQRTKPAKSEAESQAKPAHPAETTTIKPLS